MGKTYTKEEKEAKLKLIADLRREGTPLLKALEKAEVPVGTHYTWTRSSAKSKKRKQKMPATGPVFVEVPVPQAEGSEEKIVMLLGTPRSIAEVLERFR